MAHKKVLYSDKWLKVVREEVIVRGKKRYVYSRVQPDVAVVIPVLADGKLLLEKHYRHTIGKYMYEFPAGMVEKGEKPLAAAKRELTEETGYAAGRMGFLFSERHSMFETRRFHFFYAGGLRYVGGIRLGSIEILMPVKFTPSMIEKMIRSGKIEDGKTIMGYLYYKNYGNKR